MNKNRSHVPNGQTARCVQASDTPHLQLSATATSTRAEIVASPRSRCIVLGHVTRYYIVSSMLGQIESVSYRQDELYFNLTLRTADGRYVLYI